MAPRPPEITNPLSQLNSGQSLALAKKRGVYPGRTPSLDMARAAELREKAAAGVPKSVLAREFGVSRETVYVYLRAGD
ncbi:helix-turn-helix domain-containing protein [Cryobacterium luteum]|uniref:helix-turn-helix domain-containing protein n=1 Tax=Cryobacterium luteum TaxID=1424661 RepID=UPI003CC5628A